MADSEHDPVEETTVACRSPDSVLGAAESKPDEYGLASRENTPVQQEVARSSPTMRPASVNSTHSGTSGGGTTIRTTTTSRRGGRIRSRSPPAMTNRAPGDRDFQGGESTGEQVRSYSPKNPSSAAAAAAAAAKALTNSGRGQPGWNDSIRRDRHGESARYHAEYDNKSYGGSQAWPGEEFGSEGCQSQSIHRDRPYEQDPNAYGDGHHRPKRQHPEHYGPYNGTAAYDQIGRYGYSDNARGGRSSDPYAQDHRSSHIRDVCQDYYNVPGGIAPLDNPPGDNRTALSYKSPTKISLLQDTETPVTVKRKGGTSRVIGTPTPIHVPRAGDPPSAEFTAPPSSRFNPQGSAASVFRGRPNEGSSGGAPGREEDTPQEILLSLRTPSTSFEEQNKKSAPPLSPEEPPKIQLLRSDPPLVFDPQRSPRGHGATLEMVPSFSLFNQSFDSLGEGVNYLGVGIPLEGPFQSHSFGPTGSGDNDNPVHLLPSPIHRDPSFGAGQGSFNAQVLGGSSSGGNLTFGMSPDNSFGNGPASGPHRRPVDMFLGGTDDGRAQSPMEVLGMYPSPSYSGGYGNQPFLQAPFRSRSGPISEGPVRSESFGPLMSQTYTRPFDPGLPPRMPLRVFPGMGPKMGSQDFKNGALAFYPFLRRNRAAFIKCSFLLPGLKAAMLESPLSSKPMDNEKSGRGKSQTGDQKGGHIMHEGALARNGTGYLEPSPQDTAIAMRRIVSSVCAFGGTITGDRSTPTQENRGGNTNSATSIFRAKDRDGQHATVTPSSSSGTPPGNRLSSRSKVKYDELLPTRYYENENRLSWEFEEIPPVGSVTDDEDENSSSNRRRDGDDVHDTDRGDDESRSVSTPHPDDSKSGTTSDDKKPDSPDQPKMRYRCKLCGQPKQNHTCPFQQSLQRSIGAMVYPAVNAFTSNEPGLLAPSLTEMNNFVTSGSESVSSPDMSPDRPSPDRLRGKAPRATTPKGKGGTHNVTPETLRSSTQSNSPGSLSTSTGGTPYRTPLRSTKRKARSDSSNATPVSGASAMVGSVPVISSGGGQKRQHAQMSMDDQSNDLLFVDAIELKPEQFRIISPTGSASRYGSYTYPSLPLPYAQRKRLSDNLFALSKEVPQLTDECAMVLREAREKDMWDLAVAELMTQVVIIIHCGDADTRMEGLRQYLLTMGIAC